MLVILVAPARSRTLKKTLPECKTAAKPSIKPRMERFIPAPPPRGGLRNREKMIRSGFAADSSSFHARVSRKNHAGQPNDPHCGLDVTPVALLECVFTNSNLILQSSCENQTRNAS